MATQDQMAQVLANNIVSNASQMADLMVTAATQKAVDRLAEPEVTSRNYQYLSEKTSPYENYEQQKERFVGEGGGLALAAMALIESTGRIVDLVKRHIFYGEEIDKEDNRYKQLQRFDVGSGASISPDMMRIMHGIFGVSTEVGELTENVLMSDDLVNAQEEIGDIHWYLAEICNAMQVSMDTILEQNIAKLQRGRFADKFTEEEALKRNVRKEREILERHAGNGQGNEAR